LHSNGNISDFASGGRTCTIQARAVRGAKIKKGRSMLALRGLSFRSLALALITVQLWLFLWPFLAQRKRTDFSLQAEEIPLVTAQPHQRYFRIVPFTNLSGSSNLDYLETGLPEMILNGMSLPVFLRDVRPPDVVLDPAGKARVNSPYSQPQLSQEVAGSREKILLEGQVYRWRPDEGALVERSSGFHVAALIDADYLLQGRIKGNRDNPVLELEFYDAVWGKKSSTVINLPSRNPYDEATLSRIRTFVESRLPGRGAGRIRVSTDRPGALVFLDDVYIGKSPLDRAVAPGSYQLRVSHEECEDRVRNIELTSDSSFRIECLPRKGNATLVVESNPPGASVFLNVDFLGTTPLKVENLKEGTHRVRISLDKHIDRFKGVRLETGKTARVSVAMTEGSTEEYYRDPGYVIADWTHHDLAFGFMLQSLVLGGGWAYSTIRANEVRESIRGQVPGLAISDVPSYSLYQIQQIENNRLDARVWDSRANLFSGAAIASLFFAGLFLWLGYEHDDKEFGELSLLERELARDLKGPEGLRHTLDGTDEKQRAQGQNDEIRFQSFLWNVAATGDGRAFSTSYSGSHPWRPSPEMYRSPFSETSHRLGLRFTF
tara:strand:+ start:16994 stop:18805 length:1812 start_codon:yes stop_codon:yes gene_type:complete